MQRASCLVVLCAVSLALVRAVLPSPGAKHLGGAGDPAKAWRRFNSAVVRRAEEASEATIHPHNRVEMEERHTKAHARERGHKREIGLLPAYYGGKGGKHHRGKGKFFHTLDDESPGAVLERLNHQALERAHKFKMREEHVEAKALPRPGFAMEHTAKRHAKAVAHEQRAKRRFQTHIMQIDEHREHEELLEKHSHSHIQREAQEQANKMRARAAVERTGKYIQRNSEAQHEHRMKREHRLEGLKEIHDKNMVHKKNKDQNWQAQTLSTAEEQIAAEARTGIADAIKKKEMERHSEKSHKKAATDMYEPSSAMVKHTREVEHKHLRKLARKSEASALFKTPNHSSPRPPAPSPDAPPAHGLEKHKPLSASANPMPKGTSKPPAAKPPAKKTTTKAKGKPTPPKKEASHEKSGNHTLTAVLAKKMKKFLPLWLFLGFSCIACVLGALVYKYREGKVFPQKKKSHWSYATPDL